MIPFIVEGIDIIYIKLGNLISCLLLREGKGRDGWLFGLAQKNNNVE